MTTSNEITRTLDNQAPHLDYYPHWLDNLADDVILHAPCSTANCVVQNRSGRC